ncbi:MAG: acetyl-CoA C-acyltransferase, partial [Deltaproteobacteria bacterium]|nr:acetyl-CoA C-acyltransferase [Deltaproteobacteria bacterium]
MDRIPQKIARKTNKIYEGVKPVKFGERKPNFLTMGRSIKNTMKDFREVVIVEACRTPYGRAGGKLKEYTAMELGAMAIQEVLRRVGGKVKSEDVDYIIMGQVVTAGCGQVPGRQASILAGVPEHVPTITVNKVCSSGIKTVDLAVQMIQLCRAEICIAGG